jgi:carbamoyl-phosphate synthase large subunit
MNILFTCAGRRTYLLKYFKAQLAGEGKIIATDMQLSAPALTAADIKIQVPAVYDSSYIDKTLAICKEHNVKALISLNDLELPIIAANKERFLAIGATPIVSEAEVIDICFDKYKTAQFIESIGLYTPKTFVNLDSAKEALKSGDLTYPLILKPRWGSGSIGIEFVNNDEELDEIYALLNKKIKKTILATASVGDEYILIQQCIKGQEYGMDVMNDLQGNNLGVAVKMKLSMRAGETDKAKTVANDDIAEIGRTIAKNLHHIGNLDCDVFEKDGKYYVLELNPRFGGGFPFSYEAGVNFPKAIIELLKGNEVDTSILKAIPDMMFAKCDYLVNVNC